MRYKGIKYNFQEAIDNCYYSNDKMNVLLYNTLVYDNYNIFSLSLSLSLTLSLPHTHTHSHSLSQQQYEMGSTAKREYIIFFFKKMLHSVLEMDFWSLKPQWKLRVRYNL